jgi:hypothetical protein
MSDQRLTIRFNTEEIAAIESHAMALEISKTELVRLAVQGLFNNASISEKLKRHIDELRTGLAAEVRAQTASIEDKQHRTTLVLLRALQAPKEAEVGLAAIFGGVYASQKT